LHNDPSRDVMKVDVHACEAAVRQLEPFGHNVRHVVTVQRPEQTRE
jgi:hypothetical protein